MTLFLTISFGAIAVLWIGLAIGVYEERSKHRPYCRCDECTSWRARQAEKGKKKETAG